MNCFASALNPFGKGAVNPFGKGPVNPFGKGPVKPFGKGPVKPFVNPSYLLTRLFLLARTSF